MFPGMFMYILPPQHVPRTLPLPTLKKNGAKSALAFCLTIQVPAVGRVDVHSLRSPIVQWPLQHHSPCFKGRQRIDKLIHFCNRLIKAILYGQQIVDVIQVESVRSVLFP